MFLHRRCLLSQLCIGCYLRYWGRYSYFDTIQWGCCVAGTPTIELETGALDATAVYASGTGTDTLTFNYTVLSTHVAADLDYKATTSLALPTNSDTIRDNLLTNATLTLATPGATNSCDQAVVIDGVRPTFTGFTANAGTTTITIATQMKC